MKKIFFSKKEKVKEAEVVNETVSEVGTEAEAEKETVTEAVSEEKTEEAADANAEEENFSILKRLGTGAKQFGIYFAIIAGCIIFWELVLRLQMGSGINGKNLFFLFFVPAEAMALTAINGIFPRKIGRFVFPFTLLLIAVFYAVQLVYYRIFGSLISVSMVGMGADAVGQFGWAMMGVILRSIGFILLLVAPVIAVLVLCLKKKVKCGAYPIILHAMAILLTIGLWVGAAEGIKIGGDKRGSAYYAFHSSISDTDSTAARVGAMTTTIVEGGCYYLGITSNKELSTLTAIDFDSIELEPAALEVASEEVSEEKSEKASEQASEKKEPEFEGVPHVYDEFDFEALAEATQDESLRDMYTYFGQRRATKTNKYTGLMEDYSLIYICAESFWTYAIDERVTPTLYKMSNKGIILNNYYNSFRNTTTNGEYAFATGLWPDVSRQADQGLDVGSFPQSSARYMPNGLGDFFVTKDVTSYAFHNYYGNYYRRRFSWPNLGYENNYFMGQGMKFTSSWPASDAEMMVQSVDKYINDDQFFAYYMTFSGHGPYNSSNYMYRKNIEEVKRRLGDDADKYTDEALGYFAGNLEFEYAMEYLLNELEKAGKLDSTLIVIAGDHYPYYLTEAGRNNLSGLTIDEFELYKSTCIMYTEGLEENIVTDEYCCNVDILPTVLNLFGIDYDSRLLMGTDIFSTGIHKAVLYDKSFITDKVVYNAKTGEVEWKINTDDYDVKNLNAYLESMSMLVDSEYAASVNIIKTNFFLHLWKDSGMITQEEYYAEVQREEALKVTMEALNEEEQRLREEAAARKAAEEAAAAAEAQDAEGTQ